MRASVMNELVERYEKINPSTRRKIEEAVDSNGNDASMSLDESVSTIPIAEATDKDAEAIVEAFVGKKGLVPILMSGPQALFEVASESFGAFARVYAFIKSGMRVVRFGSDSLREKILSTDIGGVKPGDIRQPFDVYYVEIGESFKKRVAEHAYIRRYVDGALVRRFADGIMISVFCRMTIVNESSGLTRSLPEEIYFMVKDDWDMEKTLERYETELTEKYGEKNDDYIEIDIAAARTAFAHVVGAGAYMSIYRSDASRVSERPPIDPKTLGRRIGKRKKKDPANRQYHYILTEPKSASREWSRSKESGKPGGRRPALVRGHYRNQPYGPMSLGKDRPRRLVWIEPYWRDLDSDVKPDGKEHIYVIR